MRWTTALPSALVEHPVLAGGGLYVTGSGGVHALSAATGAHRWSAFPGPPPSGPVAVERATVLIGLRSGEVVAYGADSGLELWRAAVGGADVLVDAEGIAVVAVGRDGMMTRLDRVSGAVRWRVDTGFDGPTGVEIRDGRVRVDGPTLRLGVEFDLATGERMGPEVLAGDRGGDRGGPPDDLSLHPGIREQVPAPTSAVTVGGIVLVVSDDRVHAFDRETHRRRWEVEIPGDSSAPLAVAARPGTLYAARGNVVTALGLPARPDTAGTPPDVWAQLARPFQLPTHRPGECPVSTFADGVFGRAAIGDHSSVAHLDDGGTVLFVPAEGYVGPLLVRGLEIDGRPALRFRQRPAVAVEELQLDERNARYAEVLHWAAALDPPGPGCWVLQLDGLDFRDTIVFQIGPSEGGTTVIG